jgi:hypothetical protein
MVRLDQRHGLAGPCQFDGADDAGHATADDDGIRTCRKVLDGFGRETFAPVGVAPDQFCAFGVYSSASSRVSWSILTVQRASVELMRNW